MMPRFPSGDGRGETFVLQFLGIDGDLGRLTGSGGSLVIG